jgi:uncharacterized membrane protein
VIAAETFWQRWRRVAPTPGALHRAALSVPLSITFTGLGCMALAASSDLANTFDAPRHGGLLVATLLLLTLLLAFVCFLAATRVPPPRLSVRFHQVARLLIYPVVLWAILTAVQTSGILIGGMARDLTQTPPRYGSDDLYYNHYNALLVLRGENPYTGPWLVDEVRYFHNLAYTPLARGRFADPRHYPSQAQMDTVVHEYVSHPQMTPPELDPATTHSYPAGAFLVDVPAVWAGLPSVGVTQIVLLLALLAVVAARTPPPWGWLVGLLILVDADGARQVAGSDFEIWPLALLAFAWLSRERRVLPALLLGAACAVKQTAWLAVPFYLIWVWRSRGQGEAVRQATIAVAAFLAFNAPWIVASSGAWLRSMALPVSLPLLPDGSGIVGLSLAGGLPLLSSWVYSGLELAAVTCALAWYWAQGYARYPYAALVLPLLPLVFAWRSSERYFVLLPVAAVVALALTLKLTMQRQNGADSERPAPADAGAAPASTGH